MNDFTLVAGLGLFRLDPRLVLDGGGAAGGLQGASRELGPGRDPGPLELALPALAP